MAGGILGIALTGLNAAQAGIRTTEHNIANVNTAGYRRQEVNYAALQPMFSGAGYFGSGVGLEAVRSQYSQFLDNEVLLSETQQAKYETYSAAAGQVDKLLGDSSSGLSTAMDNFFSAVNELANDPTSNAARQVMLSAGENLAGRIRALDGKLRDYITAGNGEIAAVTTQANVYAGRIATLNNDIARAEAANGGTPANDLRDQRQQLISELNKLVNVSLVQQPDGSTNVFVGSGQPLVVGNSAYTLSTTTDPNNTQLQVPTIDVGGTTLTLDSDLITGGKLGGLLSLREEVILPAFDDLNRIAVAMGTEVNRVHRGGLDYNLAAGGAFFTDPIAGAAGNTGTLRLTLGNDLQLVRSDYTLTYNGANYTLTRLSDGAVTGPGAVATVQDQENALRDVAERLKAQPGEVAARIQQIQDQVKTLEKELARYKSKLAGSQSDDLLAQAVEISGIKVLAATIDGADAKALREMADKLRDKLKSCALVLGSAVDGKVALIAAVTSDLIAKVKAGELVNFVAGQVGGKGGGKPDMAQAGGSEPDKLPAALANVADWVRGKLN